MRIWNRLNMFWFILYAYCLTWCSHVNTNKKLSLNYWTHWSSQNEEAHAPRNKFAKIFTGALYTINFQLLENQRKEQSNSRRRHWLAPPEQNFGCAVGKRGISFILFHKLFSVLVSFGCLQLSWLVIFTCQSRIFTGQ